MEIIYVWYAIDRHINAMDTMCNELMINEHGEIAQGRHVQLSASFFLFDQDGAIREIAHARCTLSGIKQQTPVLYNTALYRSTMLDR